MGGGGNQMLIEGSSFQVHGLDGNFNFDLEVGTLHSGDADSVSQYNYNFTYKTKQFVQNISQGAGLGAIASQLLEKVSDISKLWVG